MSSFGVNIEDVWHQGSLLPPQQLAPKRSKYTVPVEDNNSNSHNMRHNNSGDNHAVDRNGVWSERSNTQKQEHPQYTQKQEHPQYTQDSVAIDLPISIPQQQQQQQIIPQQYLVETMNNNNNNLLTHPVQSVVTSLSQPQESDVAREYIVHYQKEIHYLKTMLQNIKKELHESQERNQHLQKRKKTEWILGFILMVIFLIVVVVLLSQIMMKLNRLIAQPLMFNV